MMSSVSKSSSDASTVASFEDAACHASQVSRPPNDIEVAMTSSFKHQDSRNSPPLVSSYAAEQPSNESRELLLHNTAPSGDSRNNKQSFCCGFLSLKDLCCHLCCLLAMVGLCVGAGILIGMSLSNANDECGVQMTTIESAKDVTTMAPTAEATGGMAAPPKPEPASPTTNPNPVPTAATDVPSGAPSFLVPPTEDLEVVAPPGTDPSNSFPGSDDSDCDQNWSYPSSGIHYPYLNHPVSVAATAMDLGHYGGSSFCRFDYVTCQPTSWTTFNSYTGLGRNAHWFKVTASENSICQANVEHKVKLTVSGAGADYDLHIFKDFSADGTPREAYQSSTNAAGMDEEVLVSSLDYPLTTDCFDYYIMVEYRSGSPCATWTLDVLGHDC